MATELRSFTALQIPASFSPDGDGRDDVWVIAGLENYSHVEIVLFNRFSDVVYRAKGAYAPWNGTYKGREVAAGIYYYVIETSSRQRPLTGWVTLRRKQN